MMQEQSGGVVAPIGPPSHAAMTLRLPWELNEWLRDTAHEERRSKTEVVVEALEKLREAS